MMSSPLVSVIVLNYNGKHYLDECLSSLIKQTYHNFEVIFIDNGSTDNSIDFIEKNYSNFVKLVKNPINYGFAKGNNIGIQASRGKYIVTLNNDTKVEECWLEELVKSANSNEQIGMCASKIYLMRMEKTIDSVGMLIYPDGSSKQRSWLEKDIGQYDKQEDVLLPSACAALYRRRMLDEIGLFDEDFFAYCEDTDFGLRGRLAGWKCVFVPRAIVYHHYSGTAGKYSNLKAFLVERNHWWVAVKNFPLFMLFISPFYAFMRMIFQVYSIFNFSSKSIKKGHLYVIIIKAYLAVFFSLVYTLKKRKRINKKVSDSEIYSWFRKYKLRIRDLALKE